IGASSQREAYMAFSIKRSIRAHSGFKTGGEYTQRGPPDKGVAQAQNRCPDYPRLLWIKLWTGSGLIDTSDLAGAFAPTGQMLCNGCSGFRTEHIVAQMMAPLIVQAAQFGLDMQTPDRQLVA